MEEQSRNHASTVSPESCSQGSTQAWLPLPLSQAQSLPRLEEKAEEQLAHLPPHSPSATLEQHISPRCISPLVCHLLFKGHPAKFVPLCLPFSLFGSEALRVFPFLPRGFIGNGRGKQWSGNLCDTLSDKRMGKWDF